MNQRQSGLISEVYIGFIDYQNAAHTSCEFFDLLERRHRSRGGIGMAEEGEFGLNLGKGRRQRKIVRVRYMYNLPALHSHKFVIQTISRHRISDVIARVNTSAHQHS